MLYKAKKKKKLEGSPSSFPWLEQFHLSSGEGSNPSHSPRFSPCFAEQTTLGFSCSQLRFYEKKKTNKFYCGCSAADVGGGICGSLAFFSLLGTLSAWQSLTPSILLFPVEFPMGFFLWEIQAQENSPNLVHAGPNTAENAGLDLRPWKRLPALENRSKDVDL